MPTHPSISSSRRQQDEEETSPRQPQSDNDTPAETLRQEEDAQGYTHSNKKRRPNGADDDDRTETRMQEDTEDQTAPRYNLRPRVRTVIRSRKCDSSAPPILPVYKVQVHTDQQNYNNFSKKKRGWQYPTVLLNICMVLTPICILFFFFMGIYMGASYIQQNLESSASPQTSMLRSALPNTRNVIKKWSIQHLHGIDLTSLGPPPIMRNKPNTQTSPDTHGT